MDKVHFKFGVAKTQQSFQSLLEQIPKWPQDGYITLRMSLEKLLLF